MALILGTWFASMNTSGCARNKTGSILDATVLTNQKRDVFTISKHRLMNIDFVLQLWHYLLSFNDTQCSLNACVVYVKIGTIIRSQSNHLTKQDNSNAKNLHPDCSVTSEQHPKWPIKKHPVTIVCLNTTSPAPNIPIFSSINEMLGRKPPLQKISCICRTPTLYRRSTLASRQKTEQQLLLINPLRSGSWGGCIEFWWHPFCGSGIEKLQFWLEIVDGAFNVIIFVSSKVP